MKDKNIITMQELNAQLRNKQKVNKYKSRIVEVDGIKFHSKKEGRRYIELKQLEKLGEITELRRQVIYPIVWDGVLITRYIADFVYRKKGKEKDTVEDVKGFRTAKYRNKKTGKMTTRVSPAYAVFKIKAKMMKVAYDIEILET